MSKKQVVILWVIAIILAASAFIVKSRSGKGFDSRTARARGQTLFQDFPAKEVARIHIKSGKEEVTLARKSGQWVVADRADYPANASNVNEFLRLVTEVKVVEGVEAEPSFAPRFGMDVNTETKDEQGTEAVFSNDAGTEIARVIFGKKLMGGEGASQESTVGRFIRNNADATGVYKVSELFPTLTATPAAWLDQQFLTVDKVKDITTSKPGSADIDWKLTRPNEDVEFALEGKQESEPLDTSATTPLKAIFSSTSLEDIVLPDKVAAVEKADGKRKIDITTTEGFDYKITVAPESAEPKVDEESGQAAQPSFLMTVEVSATLPAERKKEEKESEADAKTKDAAFNERKAVLEKRLADQKAISGRTFKVSSWTVEALMKSRADFIKKPEAPAAHGRGGPQGFPGGLQGLPPGALQGLPPGAARRPVQAVTPPVAIPPSEEDEGDGQ